MLMSCKNLLKTVSVIILLCVSQLIMAQERVISGRVTDSKDTSGVPGVTITAKGTKTGTATKSDGTFTLTVPSNVTTLVVSSVGYATQEVSIGGQTSLEVSLVATSGNMNEVVVTGYGTARRKDLTGATATVREKDFNKGVYTSPDQLIQGKAAGVLVINNTGQPGGSTTVRIRGSSSIRSGNQPLFVVDGVPLSGGTARPGGNGGDYGNDGGNPLNFINPSDIASIEILKDASATAIYGSRGANGVILISTKRGKSGNPTVEVSASTSVSNVLKKLEVLNASEYRQALKDYSITGGDFGGDVDAFDAITRTALTQTYNMGIGGGTENGRYRISAGYLDQKVKEKNYR